jgi:hypothetical protein
MAPVEPTITPGFVGYDKDGHFVHYCHCGKWAAYGYGVRLLADQLGTWYCAEHRPRPSETSPPPPPLPPPPVDDDRDLFTFLGV